MNLCTDEVKLDFEKYADGLVPVVVQDSGTASVLMLGFMNAEAFTATRSSGKVTFYSRSKKRLWTKGERSGNFLSVEEILVDCDRDTLLIKVQPAGPVCHTGNYTCFGETRSNKDFLYTLEKVIKDRQSDPKPGSYTSKLFHKGIDKIAQKVGEEAVELIIEAKNNDDELLLGEAADLFYHFLVLLVQRNIEFDSVLAVLKKRSNLTR